LWSEDEETFIISICYFKIFDIKATRCEVQMALMTINAELRIQYLLGGSCPGESCPAWRLS